MLSWGSTELICVYEKMTVRNILLMIADMVGEIKHFGPLVFCTNPGPGLSGTSTALLALLIAYAVLTNSVLVSHTIDFIFGIQ